MDATLDELTAAIKRLSNGEQRELKEQLAYAEQNSREASKATANRMHIQAYGHIWQAVVDAAGPAVGLPPIGVAVRELKHFADLMEALEDLLARGCPGASRTQQLAVVRVAIECLIDELQNRKPALPISGRTLTDAHSRLWSAVERDYPGYARAGLLGRVALLAA